MYHGRQNELVKEAQDGMCGTHENHAETHKRENKFKSIYSTEIQIQGSLWFFSLPVLVMGIVRDETETLYFRVKNNLKN